MYWSQKLASQNKDLALKAQFTPVAKLLAENETIIVNELSSIQGNPVDINGYYLPKEELVEKAMRASKTLKSILTTI